MKNHNFIKILAILIATITINFAIAKSSQTVSQTDIARLRTVDEPLTTKEEVVESSIDEKLNSLSSDTKEFVAKIDSISSMTAEFQQIEQSLSLDSEANKARNVSKPSKISGKLNIAKPNKLKWEILSPDSEQQVYTTDGDKLWHYDKNLEQVVKDNFNSKKLTSSPFYFLLSNIENISENYQVTKINKNLFRLKPNTDSNLDSNYVSDLKLEFDDDTNAIKNITFIAAQNKQVIISLNSVKINPQIIER